MCDRLLSGVQGKIERYHRSMKNQILLENYYLPGELKKRIGQFVSYYNNARYHERLDNLTPADVCFGHGEKILNWRAKIKKTNVGTTSSTILSTEGSLTTIDERDTLLKLNFSSPHYFDDIQCR